MTGLYHWYLEKVELKNMEEEAYIAHGIVTGHPWLPELCPARTSAVTSIDVDPTAPDVIFLQTHNTKYHCHMREYNYEKCGILQEEDHTHAPKGLSEWLSRLEEYAAKYSKPQYPKAPEGAILLRLGVNRRYYFDSMEINLGNGISLTTNSSIHIGTFQDSVLCTAHGELPDDENYDLRYFPFKDGNLSFYLWCPNGRPVYLENVGDRVLKIQMGRGGSVYVLQPGERRIITPETANPGAVLTSETDLYNAWDLPPIPVKTVVGEDGEKRLVRIFPKDDDLEGRDVNMKTALHILDYVDKNDFGSDSGNK